MNQTFLFQYNLPVENCSYGTIDHIINVVVRWYGDTYSSDGRPIVLLEPIVEVRDLRAVKNWNKVLSEIEKIGEAYFAEQAKQERINQARKELEAAGEFDNPVLDRFCDNVHPVMSQIIQNHFAV
jgi:hypothetical protein